jgi:hypothetical protein
MRWTMGDRSGKDDGYRFAPPTLRTWCLFARFG